MTPPSGWWLPKDSARHVPRGRLQAVIPSGGCSKLDFSSSGEVAQRLGQAFNEAAGVGKGRMALTIPGGLQDRTRWSLHLALGLHTEVAPSLLEGHFQLPASDEPGEDPGRVRTDVPV
jgi:hypothetical protein